MKQAHRFSGPGQPYEGLTKQTKAGPQWTGKIRTVDSALLEPLSWRKPQRIFVNSMSDLFHEQVPFEFIDRVFAIMALAPRHTFQILTKRPQRMLDYLTEPIAFSTSRKGRVISRAWEMLGHRPLNRYKHEGINGRPWPLPNVWLGVSAEDQQRADERIPLLLQTPAAVRFVSAEPLIGPITFKRGHLGVITDCGDCHVLDVQVDEDGCCQSCGADVLSYGLDWVIAGGESGPKARPSAIEWIESIVAQCKAAHVPVFVKQLGAFVSEGRTAPADCFSIKTLPPKAPNGEYWAWRAGLADRKGSDPAEWPADLRVQQFPEREARFEYVADGEALD